MRILRLSIGAIAGAVALMALSGPGQAAVTEETFISRTTNDLVALCSAEPTDRLYTAAVNFCHGFGVGVYSVLAAAQRADPKLDLFCAPPQITRNEAVAAFLTWANGKPERLAMPAVDGIAAFLNQSYPCPKATPTRRTK